ncbi:hypothetical protein E2C01_067311 [Portunus trituberculatus]|uniref:Uncharacterized protein n=1 Tax=Portunus trituberculatus TaxID=210409 RepID=A0A5B7HTA9_PORTR|nr:hypothetical protein [Portunus trituberculatus]
MNQVSPGLPPRPNAGHRDASMPKIAPEKRIWCPECSHTLQASSNRIFRVPKPIFPATRQTTLTNSCKQHYFSYFSRSHHRYIHLTMSLLHLRAPCFALTTGKTAQHNTSTQTPASPLGLPATS